MYKGALTSDDQQPILPWSHGHTKAPQYIMQLGLAHADAAYIRAHLCRRNWKIYTGTEVS